MTRPTTKIFGLEYGRVAETARALARLKSQGPWQRLSMRRVALDPGRIELMRSLSSCGSDGAIVVSA